MPRCNWALQRLTGADRDAEDLSREPQTSDKTGPRADHAYRYAAARYAVKTKRHGVPLSRTALRRNQTTPIGRTDNTDGESHIALFDKCNNLSQCADSLVSNDRPENWGRTRIYKNFRRADSRMPASSGRVIADTNTADNNTGRCATQMVARRVRLAVLGLSRVAAQLSWLAVLTGALACSAAE